MPTVNQLVRKGRGSKTRKSKAPVLLVGVNSIRRKQTNNPSPQKRGVCTRVGIFFFLFFFFVYVALYRTVAFLY